MYIIINELNFDMVLHYIIGHKSNKVRRDALECAKYLIFNYKLMSRSVEYVKLATDNNQTK